MDEQRSRTDGEPQADLGGFETARLAARLLQPGNEALLQMVFAQAGDYFLRVNGSRVPDPDAAARELGACAAAPGREVALLTLLSSGEPAGAFGWWRGNPEPDVALLGMLMMTPEHRGQGLAGEAVAGLAHWLAARGVRRLRTAVDATAFREHRLLRALGFEQLPIRDHVALGLAGSHLALFEQPLG